MRECGFVSAGVGGSLDCADPRNFAWIEEDPRP